MAMIEEPALVRLHAERKLGGRAEAPPHNLF
jgi:hypothetical protein